MTGTGTPVHSSRPARVVVVQVERGTREDWVRVTVVMPMTVVRVTRPVPLTLTVRATRYVTVAVGEVVVDDAVRGIEEGRGGGIFCQGGCVNLNLNIAAGLVTCVITWTASAVTRA